MGTYTKTLTENSGGAGYVPSTWTFTVNTTADEIVANSTRTIIPTATVSMKYSPVSGKNAVSYKIMSELMCHIGTGTPLTAEQVDWNTGEYSSTTPLRYPAVMLNANTNTSVAMPEYNRVTSGFFRKSNATQRSVNVDYRLYFSYLCSGKYAGAYELAYPFGELNTSPSGVYLTIGTIKVTLDAPPTYQCTDPYYNTDFIYAGLTTASVDVSELTAQYGGYITSAELKIGSQTATLTGDATDALTGGTLSIPLNTAGTFTPAITITDSRGQTSTKTFTTITVGEYVAPSASFSVLRTNASGVQDDEGAYALLTTTINYTNAVAKLTQPLTTLDGVSESATWYTDRALTNAVDWTNYNPASPVTLYGILGGNLSTVQSYTIGLTPTDSDSSGSEITQTLATAFYTIDFLAGGHGIAFGQPATQDGFECNMVATFHEPVTAENDIYITIDENATVGTTDGDLYDALVTLGWI